MKISLLKYRILPFIFFYFSYCFLSAQDQRLDSLKQKLKTAQNDTIRVQALYDLYQLSEQYEAEKYSEELKVISLKHLATDPNNKFFLEMYGYYLSNIAAKYDRQGLLDKSIRYSFHSLKIFEKAQSKMGQAEALNEIGVVYEKQDEFGLALEYHQKSLKFLEEINNIDGIAVLLNNIGLIYLNQNEYNKSLEYYERALKIYESNHNEIGRATMLIQIGAVFSEQNQLDKALEYYNESLSINEKTKDYDRVAVTEGRIAVVKLKQNKPEEALLHAEKCYNIAKQNNYLEYVRYSAGLLKKIYQKQHKYKEAFSMYELEIQMRDSINNNNVRRVSLQKELEYQYGKKETEIKAIAAAEKEKIKIKAEEDKRRQNVIIYSVLAGLILVGIFSIFIFRSLQQNKKANKIITQQKQEVEQQNQLIEQQRHVLSEKNKEISDSVNYALGIQKALLASEQYIQQQVPNSFILFKPKDVVSGDFYWFDAKEDLLLFAVADCTGHGVPGSMMSMIAINLLRLIVNEKKISSPQQVLTELDKQLTEMLHSQGHLNMVNDGMDIAFVEYNKQTQLIRYSGANRPLWIIKKAELNKEQELIEVRASKYAIGGQVSEKVFDQHQIQLHQGDSIYLTTDGYADQFGGPKGKKLMTKVLKEKLADIHTTSMHEQKQQLSLFFDQWKSSYEQVDDVTIMGIKV